MKKMNMKQRQDQLQRQNEHLQRVTRLQRERLADHEQGIDEINEAMQMWLKRMVILAGEMEDGKPTLRVKKEDLRRTHSEWDGKVKEEGEEIVLQLEVKA